LGEGAPAKIPRNALLLHAWPT